MSNSEINKLRLELAMANQVIRGLQETERANALKVITLTSQLLLVEAEIAEQRITISDLRSDRDLAAYRDYYS